MKRLAGVLTRLYPASWRERYGEEFEALLEQCPGGPRMVANTACGAVSAWLRWPATATAPSARLRGAVTAVLWGGLAVLVAVSGFVKAEIPATHASVHAVGSAMVAVALGAAAVMAAGAIAPAVKVTRLAIAQRRADVLRLVAAPPLAGLVFFGGVALAARVLRGLHISAPVGHTLFWVAAALFTAAAIVTGRAASLALRRMDPGARALRASLPFGVLTVMALAAVTGLMVAYAVMLSRYEPWLAHRANGPAGTHIMVRTQLIITTVEMGLGTLLAGAGLAQGTLSRRAPG
ncbi:MAG: hypothetical protein ACM3ML_33780 [Micromonosporaceae bacterium]